MKESEAMSGRNCFLCGKGAMQGRFVSHANNKTKRRMEVNLRVFKIPAGGVTQKVKLCIKCLRQEKEKLKKNLLVQKAEKVMSASQAAQKEKTFG